MDHSTDELKYSCTARIFATPLDSSATLAEARGSAVPATAFINSSLIKCTSPPALNVRNVRVEVSNNGADPRQSNQSTIGRWFNFDRLVKILNIFPKMAPIMGNSSVRVVGENFLPTDEMKCKFGSYIVQGIWLNGHEMVCRTPPHPAGSYPLEITANNQDYTSQELPFIFYKPLYMVQLDPVSGPADAAGTEMRIYGGNFLNTSTLSCRVADVTVPAEYVSDTEVICYTPPCLNSYTGGRCKMMYQPLSAHQNKGRKDPRTGSLKLFPTAHYYPLYLSKLVPVEVSNNAQDFTDSGFRFLYQQDARIISIAPNPARGFDTGYTSLYISGRALCEFYETPLSYWRPHHSLATIRHISSCVLHDADPSYKRNGPRTAQAREAAPEKTSAMLIPGGHASPCRGRVLLGMCLLKLPTMVRTSRAHTRCLTTRVHARWATTVLFTT